jgi:hypothetical protein
MKKTLKLSVIISMITISSFSLFAQEIPLDSLYLGQTPPGNIPKIFNLPLLGGLRPIERVAISSDGKEIYFGLLNTYPPSIQKTKCFIYLENHWQGPFDVFENQASPRLSINDSIMYTQTNINDFSTTYRSLKTDSGWCLPQKLLNVTQQTHYFQTTALNNSYVSSNLPATPNQRDICKLSINGTDTLIQSLGMPINTSYDENDLFVSDDESYLLFSRNIPGGGGDIYLSFKKVDGNWTNPKKLGEPINKPGYSWEYGMFVSKDTKYLFYTSGGTSMSSYYTYWVRIDNIIDSLRYTNFAPYLLNQIPNQTDSVGYNYNYTFPDTTFIDDDGNNTLTYSANLSNGNPLPAWLSFDPATRTFEGTPTEAININVKVTAMDSANANVSCTFAINVTITGVEETKEQLPESMELYQNYPNPFNPTTTIEFAIPNSEFVSLRIYDTLGKEVKEVFSGNLNAGNHSFEFDANNISSGVYFCVLKTSVFCKQRKMIVLK